MRSTITRRMQREERKFCFSAHQSYYERPTSQVAGYANKPLEQSDDGDGDDDGNVLASIAGVGLVLIIAGFLAVSLWAAVHFSFH